MDSSSANSAWWSALTLDERLNHCGPRYPGLPSLDRPATARRRFEEWRSQSPFHSDKCFECRLAFDDLDEASFYALLGESESSLQRRFPEIPTWLSRIAHAFNAPAPFPPKRLPVVGPLVAQAHALLNEKAQKLAHEWPSLDLGWRSIVEQLVSAMISRIDERISRAVVLEMRVAVLNGSLTGENGSKRFQSFLERLRDPCESLSFLQQYPVLARVLIGSIDDWTNAAEELLERLCIDWDLIHSTFWPGVNVGPLTNIEMGLGDLHRKGREVCVLHFGSGRRLVYKPRSLRIDGHFASLLSWLREKGAAELWTPKVLDRGIYGWSEFVYHSPCASKEEARRFYIRQGSLLAILYILNANDFHHGNLIAAAEYPVPIDLETLCNPDYGQANEDSYDSYAEFELKNSVVNTLLLPVFQEGEGRRAVDRSGIGGREGQMSINPMPAWEYLATDQMRLSFRRRELSVTHNRPHLDGNALNPFQFVDEIESGFRSMYRLLETHRGDLLSSAGPLSAMHTDEVRVVFRATQLYDMILNQSYHPDYLGDALDRERLFDRLWFGIDRTEFPKTALRLIQSERRDLWRGEIPYFTTRMDSKDLLTGEGICLTQLFVRSGWDMVCHRLSLLGENDLRRQLWYIRGSLSTLALNHEAVFQTYPLPIEIRSANRDRLLAQGSAIGERIVNLARWRNGCASWIGLAFGESYGWHLHPLQTDLYSGLPGIVLFLSYAEAVTGREEFKAVALAALATLQKQMKRRRSGLEFIGGFDGWGGLIYVWIHLLHLWKQESLLADTDAMVSRIEELAERDEHMDVMQGASGAVVPLIMLHKVTGATRPLDLARKLGNRIVKQAQPCGEGVGWVGTLFPDQPLTGFSHGASGFAWALAELFAITGEQSYARTALQAVAFERGHFSDASGNWADLRQVSRRGEETRSMTAWCHGACGIGMSRLRMHAYLSERMIREDLEIALQTTYREGFGTNHSLCHGDLGCLDFMLQASLCFPESEWNTRLAERVSQSLASMEQHGWRCGVPLQVETPGLIDGLAGIGYELLRLAEPAVLPSVLVLEGPKGTLLERRIC
jgi:type 2 lantibiotic biosynthesis protein LanM